MAKILRSFANTAGAIVKPAADLVGDGARVGIGFVGEGARVGAKAGAGVVGDAFEALGLPPPGVLLLIALAVFVILVLK